MKDSLPNMDEVVRQAKEALENASLEHLWVTDGCSIGWLDGNPLQGTYRTVAMTEAKTPTIFNNPNAENDSTLITNAPEWLRLLIEEREQLKVENDRLNKGVVTGEYMVLADGREVEIRKDPLLVIQDLRSKVAEQDKELKQYKAALEWYADDENHENVDGWGERVRSKVYEDGGELARNALKPQS